MASDGAEHIVAMATLKGALDAEAEDRARRLLEGFGLVPIDSLEDFARLSGSADYIVDLEGDIDALCSFSALVVPRLRKLGWNVDIDDRYLCHTVGEDAPWYATADADGPSWFQLELGIELNGQRVNILPVLVDLIERDGERLSLKALERHRHRFLALPLGGTRYLAVPPERVAQVVKVLFELYNREPLLEGKLRLPKGRMPVIDQLASIDDELSLEGASLATPLPPFEPPKGLRATLRPYQCEGVAWLEEACERGNGVILADDMGLGKTLQTITHLLLQKERGRLDLPVLIVCPTSLVGNWQREIAQFAPSLRTALWHGAKRAKQRPELAMADVIITSYPLLVRDTETFGSIAFAEMVLDEAQAIKSARSLAHKAVKQVITRHRVALTGTPVENGLDELWALFDVLQPGWLGSAETFRNTFQYPIEKLRSDTAMAALRERIRPFILRRMKSEVAKDLPPKTELVRTVELEGAQRDLYESIRIAAHEQVRKAVRDRGVSGAAIDILDALLKLRQVCCDPRLVSVPAARAVRESAKLELLHAMLDEARASKQRVLVFSQFATMLELISKDLKRRETPHAILTGATVDRQSLVEQFQRGEHDVFLISLKAGGTGLTLTAAETVIHYDPWWNPAVQSQATDRAYRIGQTKPVFAFNLVVAGSVEERILGLQRKKRELADGVLSGSALRSLSANEVESLFDPLDA